MFVNTVTYIMVMSLVASNVSLYIPSIFLAGAQYYRLAASLKRLLARSWYSWDMQSGRSSRRSSSSPVNLQHTQLVSGHFSFQQLWWSSSKYLSSKFPLSKDIYTRTRLTETRSIYIRRENRRRDQLAADLNNEDRIEAVSFLDKTDREQLEFRYMYWFWRWTFAAAQKE